MKTIDEDYAISRSYSSYQNIRNGKSEIQFMVGTFYCKNGSVEVYQQGYPKTTAYKILRLSVNKNGREYHRTIRGKLYTDIGVSRKAGEFIREIDSIINESNKNSEQLFLEELKGYINSGMSKNDLKTLINKRIKKIQCK